MTEHDLNAESARQNGGHDDVATSPAVAGEGTRQGQPGVGQLPDAEVRNQALSADTERMEIKLEAKTHEDDDTTLVALRTPDGFIDPDLQHLVEQAIREYPNSDAEWWLGGVAAIRIVEAWLVERGTLIDGPGGADG